jgi:hypothetical protein
MWLFLLLDFCGVVSLRGGVTVASFVKQFLTKNEGFSLGRWFSLLRER